MNHHQLSKGSDTKLIRPNRVSGSLIAWFVGFIVLMVVFVSLASPIITRPDFFNRVGSVSLYTISQTADLDTRQSNFGTSDVIKAVIEYKDAQQGLEVAMVFVRLSTNPKATNGREILTQVTVPLSGKNGIKKYSFPAFERKPGNYEVLLQSNTDIIEKIAIAIK